MKTIRVLVLLLLASVHVFTAAEDTGDKKVQQPETTPSSKVSVITTVPAGASNAAPTKAASTAPPNAAPTAPPSAAPTAPPKAATTAPPNAAPTVSPNAAPTAPPNAGPTALPHVLSTVLHKATSKVPDKKTEVSTPAPQKPASPTVASTDLKTVTTTPVAVERMDNKTSVNDSLQPRSSNLPNPGGNNSETATQGPDGSTEKTNIGKAGTPAPAPGTPSQNEKDKMTGAGSQTGCVDTVPLKPASDKRLWWILLPVLLVGAAAAIMLKFKCKKIHDHTETIDTGTENASFQSRPESTKDGVMLLGVKSSGGEENAAAR